MHVAQLMEKDNTVANQQLDLLRANEKNRELEKKLRQAEEASRTTVNQLWERRIEMAKEELRQEMQNIVSSTVCGTDQRLCIAASATISQMPLDDECQFHNLWECFVVVYHILFQIEGAGMHFLTELTPWRRVANIDKEGMSVEDKQKMEKFEKEIQHVTPDRRKGYSDSDWQNMMRIYKKLWPFKGPTPEALDWWSLSTQELLQAVPWTNLCFLFI